jgi:4-alpha-glucanotransferase
MRFAPLDRNFTGVSLPVAALRTRDGCGVGEFADLAALGTWCAEAGLEVIQLLPVNDTGTNSSPYSALSAFALHPLYLRLQDLPGAGRYAEQIMRFQEESAERERSASGRFSYGPCLDFKLSTLSRLYEDNAAAIARDRVFERWRTDNPWVVPYAVFTALKKKNLDAPWSTWPELSDPGPGEIVGWWKAHSAQCMPVAWGQFQLEGQLAKASRTLGAQGVFLKGDLPILMSRESADVWAERACFDLSACAGAPPDMFSPDGQQWGFPVYDWDRLEKDGHRWWKERLRQAGKFFHAFRIDHVLGFFRIWRIRHGEVTALLGRFSPSIGLGRRELEELGFDKGRLRWLTVPHVTGAELEAALGADAPRAAGLYLKRIGGEDLYNLAAEVDGETAIERLAESPEVKRALRSWHVDRTLLDENGEIYPAWYMERRKGFGSLSDPEKDRLRELAGRRRRESEDLWEEHGRRLLATLKEATDMLVCAEDLGDVPRCVPRVLDELSILGLRIVRWSREYDRAAPGSPAPFIPPESYPPLSVCTPSVHDTSTIRGWWEEDRGEREQFWRFLGEPGTCPELMTPDLLAKIVSRCCGAASRLCMFQLQDLLDLDPDLWSTDPRRDRINVPGTVNAENWTWRMPLAVEELAARAGLSRRVRALTDRRRARYGKGGA